MAAPPSRTKTAPELAWLLFSGYRSRGFEEFWLRRGVGRTWLRPYRYRRARFRFCFRPFRFRASALMRATNFSVVSGCFSFLTLGLDRTILIAPSVRLDRNDCFLMKESVPRLIGERLLPTIHQTGLPSPAIRSFGKKKGIPMLSGLPFLPAGI